MSEETNQDESCCWICLEDQDTPVNPLIHVCKCPTKVHNKCLANWQIHNIGKPEENHCRFCKEVFPDWKDLYKPSFKPRTLTFKVMYNGKTFIVPVNPGDMEGFEKQVRKVCHINPIMDMSVTYVCKLPNSTQSISFKSTGLNSHEYESATHLAAYARTMRQGGAQTENIVVENINTNNMFVEKVKKYIESLKQKLLCYNNAA